MVDSRHFIFDEHIKIALDRDEWGKSVEEGRLMLFELTIKVQAGFYVSHTERRLLDYFNFINKNGKPSKIAREFLFSMIDIAGNGVSLYCELHNKYR